jgi:3-methyladenine DNA glycosylase AlkD
MRVDEVLAALRKRATKRTRDGLARYGIPSENALGVSVGDLRKLAKSIGRDHDLAQALWKTGVYEARMLASFVDEPERVTTVQMDRWCRDFDSWAIVDTVCFQLFDRTPHGFRKGELTSKAATKRLQATKKKVKSRN